MGRLRFLTVFFLWVSVGVAQVSLTSYEYWYNDDFTSKTTVPIAPTQQLNLNQAFSTSGLFNGINCVNFRTLDDSGRYSSILSQFFYKDVISSANPNSQIVSYEYWIDTNYSNVVSINTAPQSVVNVNALIPMSGLANGLHNFNLRFKDNMGLWSGVVSHFFYKIPEAITATNVLTEYRYWLNNDFLNATTIALASSPQVFVVDSFNFSQISKGNYEINFQFKDTLGNWSVVLTDTFVKAPLPIADFTYAMQPYCDSSVVSFVDGSVDGDVYLWDFGDGNTSSLANPIHTYNTPNTYQVSLTVTDSVSGLDSTLVIPIQINSLNSASTITEVACDSFTAPDGIVHTTSGIKTAVLSNMAGCDSTITINLTINQSSTSSIIDTACDSYTAPDGVIYTNSGIITATIPNAAGCDSVITIQLTIISIDTTVIQVGTTLTANVSGANYQWLDCDNGKLPIMGETNQSFTATQNGNYAVAITQNNCTDTSICYAIANVGVIENNLGTAIKVYPNPTDGFVKIDLGVTLPEFKVNLVDVNGKMIQDFIFLNTQSFELDLAVQSGVYLLIINSENKNAIIKLVVN